MTSSVAVHFLKRNVLPTSNLLVLRCSVSLIHKALKKNLHEGSQ